jgi:hypothetical protein
VTQYYSPRVVLPRKGMTLLEAPVADAAKGWAVSPLFGVVCGPCVSVGLGSAPGVATTL